jgi:hypothetical protein
VADRFWAKVDTSAGRDGCWPWLGSTHWESAEAAITRKSTKTPPVTSPMKQSIRTGTGVGREVPNIFAAVYPWGI